jgi:hypothetical protein
LQGISKPGVHQRATQASSISTVLRLIMQLPAAVEVRPM